jgi:hypothetical protein
MENVTIMLDQAKKIKSISGIEDKAEALLHSDSNKGKISNHDHNIQHLRDIIKKQNLLISGSDERQTKSIQNPSKACKNYPMKL